MKFIFYLLLFFIVILTSCKKDKACPNLEGNWLLTEIWQDNLKTVIADTSVISEILEIDGNNTFISSSTKTGKIWNSGNFDCTKVFEVDSISFKKGSNTNFNLYVRIQ